MYDKTIIESQDRHTHTAALAVSGQIQVSAVFPTSIDSGSVPDSSTGSLPYTGLGISFLNSNIYNKQNIIKLPKKFLQLV